MQTLLYALVAFIASGVGSICGMGGGIIIKPVLDLLQTDTAEVNSFLSGCTILAMTLYTVGRSVTGREHGISFAQSTPLALGAFIGGYLGKQLFAVVQLNCTEGQQAGGIQALLLVIVIGAVLCYTVLKKWLPKPKPKAYHRTSCAVLGLLLGICASFAGIGGGPINVVMLQLLFGMDSRSAAKNSLYIVLFSQAGRLLTALATGTVPACDLRLVAVMVLCGILGGGLGKRLSGRLSNEEIDHMFGLAMAAVILVNLVNLRLLF